MRGVEVHVVHPPAARVDPAGAQAILQRLKGNVQADDQVQLTDPVQRLGLPQRARETCIDTASGRGVVRGKKAAVMEPNPPPRSCRTRAAPRSSTSGVRVRHPPYGCNKK